LFGDQYYLRRYLFLYDEKNKNQKKEKTTISSVSKEDKI
jgi:hypothetical protein